MTTAPEMLKRRIAEGLVAFPATPFTQDGELDVGGLEEHIATLAAHRPSLLVPAGGAGELFSLSAAEHETICRIAVAEKTGIPVMAGVGFGVAMATEMARTAERAGADAILLFSPYLITPDQEGLAAYVAAVCRAVGIGVVAYSRNNGVLAADTALRLADACPNFIAVKDGTGDFEGLVSLKQRAGDRLTLINGVPTAEIIAPQCFAIGIRSYSSAVFSFLPEFALAYFRAVRDGDEGTVNRMLAEFYVPLTAIRNRKRGYAVALVKAGLGAVGQPAGPVRPPLVDFSPADARDLALLIERARALTAGAPAALAAKAR